MVMSQERGKYMSGKGDSEEVLEHTAKAVHRKVCGLKAEFTSPKESMAEVDSEELELTHFGSIPATDIRRAKKAKQASRKSLIMSIVVLFYHKVWLQTEKIKDAIEEEFSAHTYLAFSSKGDVAGEDLLQAFVRMVGQYARLTGKNILPLDTEALATAHSKAASSNSPTVVGPCSEDPSVVGTGVVSHENYRSSKPRKRSLSASS